MSYVNVVAGRSTKIAMGRNNYGNWLTLCI